MLRTSYRVPLHVTASRVDFNGSLSNTAAVPQVSISKSRLESASFSTWRSLGFSCRLLNMFQRAKLTKAEQRFALDNMWLSERGEDISGTEDGDGIDAAGSCLALLALSMSMVNGTIRKQR